jgi:transcriptional regulator with XRE-family HTH domain
MEARDTLRAAMARGGLSTQAVADLCGVTRRTVQNWLAGNARIPDLALQATVDAAFLVPVGAQAKAVLAMVVQDQERVVAALEAVLEAERQALTHTTTQLKTLEEQP